ncbi:Phosphatidylinositol 4-kinase alpha [Thelohanellus kitauei]|uniref:Phosphatidylinositol 4-kinase alpha n=1 Tax=Thelohanellus kitauei TaxID=669202 RepID=A0A0C2N1A9_THEKT|nr:Phosphatidylinositol 4-kinase alpha [Thelohanellus kitauei]
MDPFKQLLMSTFTPSKTGQETHRSKLTICTSISNNFQSLALYIEASDIKLKFMEDMLELFITLSTISRKTSMGQDKLDVLLSIIYLIIQALSSIMKRIGKTVAFTQSTQELFKKFWVYSIVNSGSGTGSFSQNTIDYFREIATFSPPLVVDHLRSYLSFNLQKDTTLNDADLFETKNLLIKTLNCSNRSDVSNAILKLPPLHIVYLVAFYEQESLAVEKDTKNFPNIFMYLEDPAIEKEKENITVIIDLICEEIFQKFINQLELRAPGSDRDQDLVNHISLLLLNFNSERKKVQRAADKYLSMLMNKFPHMLWNSSVIRIMLDFMNILNVTCEKLDYGNMASMIIDVPHTKLRYSIPDTKEKRNEIILDFKSRCQSLINEATRCAPSIVSSIFLDYVVDNRFSFKEPRIHYGMEVLLNSMILPEQPKVDDINDSQMTNVSSSLLQDSSFSKKAKDRNEKPSYDFKTIVSNCIFTASGRIQYIGQIHGLLVGKTHEIINGKKVYPEFEKSLKLSVASKDKMSKSEFENFVMLCTAYICTTRNFLRKLVFYLCNCPVTNFNIPSIEFSIQSWEWIFTTCTNRQMSLLSMICKAWETTAKMKLGMFNFEMTMRHSRSYHTNQATVHDIWLKYLIEKFDQVKYYSDNQVSVIARFVGLNVQLILDEKHKLKEEYFEINSLPYIRLMIFGLKLLEKQYLSNLICRLEYRERILKAILIYFSVDPIWPDPLQTKNLIDSIYMLYKLLINDRKWQNNEKELLNDEDFASITFDSYFNSITVPATISKKV